MAAGFSVFVQIGAKLLPSLNTSANAVEKRFGTMSSRLKVRAAETKLAWKEMSGAMSPMIGMAAAGGLSMTFMKAVGDSSHLAHEIQNLRNSGRSASEVAAGMVAANKAMMALPTTTLLDNLKVLNETTGAFGNFQHAIDNLTFNQRIGSMMQNMLGEKAGDPGEMFNNIVRGMEMRGATQDHARYQREIGELYKAMVFTGGRVNPQEFFNFAQGANPYIKNYSQRFLTRVAPSMIQEYGGDRAGTMANSWGGTILGKAKNKITTEAFIKLGLLDPKGIVYNKVGPVGWKPGAMKGTDLAMRDPLAWTEKVLIPALTAHGFKTDNPIDVAKALMPLFRNGTAYRMATSLVFDKDRQRLHKDEGLINKVPGVNAAYKASLRADPMFAWTALKSSLTNLSSVLFGGSDRDSPVAIALYRVAGAINHVAATVLRHRWLGKALGGALGLGAGLATLKVFGIGLRWAFSPLRGIFSLVSKLAAPMWRFIGPAMMRGFLAAGTWIRTGLLRFGPIIWAGMRALGPWLLRGLGLAFEFLSGPVGWAMLAVSAGLLIYRYRAEIAKGWHALTGWFRATAWPAITSTLSSLGDVGARFVDNLIKGIAGAWPRLKTWLANSWTSTMPTWLGGSSAPAAPASRAPAPLPLLMRPVAPRREPRAVAPARPTKSVVAPLAANSILRKQAAAGGVHVKEIHIHEAHNPHATAKAVRHELRKLAHQQASGLHD